METIPSGFTHSSLAPVSDNIAKYFKFENDGTAEEYTATLHICFMPNRA